MQHINKYVLTSTAAQAGETATKLSGDTADAGGETKTWPRDGACSSRGAARYIRRCSPHTVIDQLLVMTFPLVCGTSKSIFNGSENGAALKLVDHFVSSTGVIVTPFEPAGSATGRFRDRRAQ